MYYVLYYIFDVYTICFSLLRQLAQFWTEFEAEEPET